MFAFNIGGFYLSTYSTLYRESVICGLSRNTKGVEFYLIELMKLLKAMGVEHYDIVPEWAKPILHYVLEHEGLGIIK